MFLYSFSFLEIKKSKNMTHCKSYTTSFILFLLVSLNIFFLFFLFLIFIVKLFSFLSKHFSHVILNINKISSMLFVFDMHYHNILRNIHINQNCNHIYHGQSNHGLWCYHGHQEHHQLMDIRLKNNLDHGNHRHIYIRNCI